MLRELVSWPISVARTAIDLPRNMQRSIREANDLMEVSREQLEVLARVVKLSEPLERAQRGGEFVAEGLKRALFGEEAAAIEAEVIVEKDDEPEAER